MLLLKVMCLCQFINMACTVYSHRTCCIWLLLGGIASITLLLGFKSILYYVNSNNFGKVHNTIIIAQTTTVSESEPTDSTTLSPTSNLDISKRTIIIDNHETLEMSFSAAVTEGFHHILPRAAYFDKRHRDRHNNATVILVHLTRTAKVVACKVNDYITKAVEVKQLSLNSWLRQKFKDCTHDNVLVVCYDTPGLNNSKVSIVYKDPKNESLFISVESEHNLLVPKERKSPTSNSTMVCTTVFDTPPHFGAWIRYQKSLGVDMVHINAHESFLSSKSFNDTFFLESLKNGFIQLQVWKEHLPPGSLFYHSQALFYQDCLYRYLGVYDYCMCADTDDFLVFRDKKVSDIHSLVRKVFVNKRILGKQLMNSVFLQWIRYIEPSKGFDLPEEKIKDGNLMRYISAKNGKNEGKFRTKSIYRLSVMAELGIHESKIFVSETKYKWKFFYGVPEAVAFVAHIKPHPRTEDRPLVYCSDV